MIMMPVNDRHVVVIHKGGGGCSKLIIYIQNTLDKQEEALVTSSNLQSITKQHVYGDMGLVR